MHVGRRAKLLSVCGLVPLLAVQVARAQSGTLSGGRPKVCSNQELIKAIRIINDACTDITCDFSKLKELDSRVDKPSLLAALRDPYLQPVHIFFPENVATLQRAFDWPTIKRNQLDSIKFIDDPENTVIYVIGRASVTGDRDLNIALSRERMQGVMSYIREHLQVRCRAFHGGWLGKEYLQLSESDARLLNLEPNDYRRDSLVLNQSVHIFVFPCADKL